MPRLRTKNHPASWSSQRRHFLFLLLPEESRIGLTIFELLLTLFEELRQRFVKHARFTRSASLPPERFGQRWRVGNNLANWSVNLQQLGANVSILNMVEQRRAINWRGPWRELERAWWRSHRPRGRSEAALQPLVQIHTSIITAITIRCLQIFETAGERGAEAKGDRAGEELGVSFLELSSRY